MMAQDDEIHITGPSSYDVIDAFLEGGSIPEPVLHHAVKIQSTAVEDLIFSILELDQVDDNEQFLKMFDDLTEMTRGYAKAMADEMRMTSWIT